MESLGEICVGMYHDTLSIAQKDTIERIKRKTAELINLCDSIKSTSDVNTNFINAAIMKYSEASMLAVKSVCLSKNINP